MITGNWGDFVKGVSAKIDEVIDQTKDLGPNFGQSGLFDEVTTDSLIYRTEGVTGLNYLENFDENDGIKKDVTYPAYKTEYVANQKGSIVEISQLLMKTRPSDLEQKLDEIRQLRITANRTLNKWAWRPLVDAFVTTDSSSEYPVSRLSDAVAMCASTHPSLVTGVSNRSNIVTGAPALSEANLFTAQKQLMEALNGRGLPINYEGGYILVVPPALVKTAVEITKSELRSGTGNNDINYFDSAVNIDVVSSTYLGSANGGDENNWFLFARDLDSSMKPMKVVTLIEPKIEKTVDFDTKSIRVSVDLAAAVGYSSWEFMMGSNPA